MTIIVIIIIIVISLSYHIYHITWIYAGNTRI